MTLEEFVKLDPKNIRRNEDLMRLFVEFYTDAFSLTPSCVGCAFNSGFKDLKKYALKGNSIKIKTKSKMETFKINKKYNSTILSYQVGGKTRRSYGKNITENFAIEFLTHGTPDQIEARKKVFDVLPKIESQAIDYHAMNYKEEILPLYDKVSKQNGTSAKSRKKADIIDYLQNECKG